MLVLTIEHESSVYIGDMKVTVLLPDDQNGAVQLQVTFDSETFGDEITPDIPVEAT